MCMRANGAWEARASVCRFVARAGRNLPLDNCVVSEPGSRGPALSERKGAYRSAAIGLKLRDKENP